MMSNSYKLQFITHHNESYSYVDSARMAPEGGCRWIQLRMKEADEVLLESTALIVCKMCRTYGATLIIDDNVELVKRVGADGVHLGKCDMPIAEARKILGKEHIIGATVNSFEDIIHALSCSTPDYFGCGPFRYTSTKNNLAPILGLCGYRKIVSKMHDYGINIPLVAIGGITSSDIDEILRCGVQGIALSGAVLNADNPRTEMSQIVDLVSTFKNDNL